MPQMNGLTGGVYAVTYRVVLSRQAQRYFAAAPLSLARRLSRIFETLESSPMPAQSKSLKGVLEGLRRIRVGNIRVVYEIKESSNEVRIVKIGTRGDIY